MIINNYLFYLASLLSFLCYVFFIREQVYTRIATFLTDWECLRTQTEHDNSLTFKFYILQFVNYYSSLFYLAFFKGRYAIISNVFFYQF